MTLKIDGATIEFDAESNKSLIYVCGSIKQIITFRAPSKFLVSKRG